MSFPSDEDLILYHYGEASEREAIERALAASAEARQRLDRLRRLLDAVPVTEPPALPPGYGAEVWTRLRPRLARRAILGAAWRALQAGMAARPWRLATAAALLLIAGFVAGRLWPRPPEEGAAGLSAAARQRILAAAVAHHLEGAERLLVEIENRGPGAGLPAARDRARQLVVSNRLFREVARQAGEPAVTQLLESLEPLLLEMAHAARSGPAAERTAEEAAWRQRLAEHDLLFRIRVVARRLRGGGSPSPAPHDVAQDTI